MTGLVLSKMPRVRLILRNSTLKVDHGLFKDQLLHIQISSNFRSWKKFNICTNSKTLDIRSNLYSKQVSITFSSFVLFLQFLFSSIPSKTDYHLVTNCLIRLDFASVTFVLIGKLATMVNLSDIPINKLIILSFKKI